MASGSNPSRAEIPYNYEVASTSGYDHKGSDRVPFFNGDGTLFAFWKTKMYSYIIGVDDDLWDLVEDGVDLEGMDDEGMVSNEKRKLFTKEQKLLYKKHHKVKGILTNAIPHSEFLKIGNKSSAKSIWDSLCSTYEGNQQVREAKANLLIQHYELFKMKEGEDIETMYARFQTLVSGLQVLKKSYTTEDHVRKILRCLPAIWRPKATAIREAKDLSKMSLEDLISSLKTHEMELLADEPVKKVKSLALKAKNPSVALKAKATETEEEDSSEEASEEDSEDEFMALMARRFQKWSVNRTKKFSKFRPKKFSSKEKNEDQKSCFKCKKPGHFIADCPELSSKDKAKKFSGKKDNFKKKFKKSLLATWEDLDDTSDEEEEANLALMASTSEDTDSDSEDELEVFSDLTKSELAESLNDVIHHYKEKSKELKTLKNAFDSLSKDVTRLYKENEVLTTEIKVLKCTVAEQIPEEHENALQEFVKIGIKRSKLASMIYGVGMNKGEGIGYSAYSFDEQPIQSSSEHKSTSALYSTFVKEKGKAVVNSEVGSEDASDSETSKTKVLNHSESKFQKPKNLNSFRTKASEVKPLKKNKTTSETKASAPKTLRYPKHQVQNHFKQNHFKNNNLKYSKPAAWPKRQYWNKPVRANQKGPIKMWVPRSEIIYVSDVRTKKAKAAIMVSGQWLLASHDRRQVYVPNPESERGRLCGVWRQPKRKDHWYRYSW